MRDAVREEMGLRPCSFTPTFASKLSNQVSAILSGPSGVGRGAVGWTERAARRWWQFHCYTNYESSGLGGFLPDD